MTDAEYDRRDKELANRARLLDVAETRCTRCKHDLDELALYRAGTHPTQTKG